jgi:hypothetical protein
MNVNSTNIKSQIKEKSIEIEINLQLSLMKILLEEKIRYKNVLEKTKRKNLNKSKFK